MKKQMVKKCNELFKEKEWIVGYKESQNVIKNNDYGITLIALVISIIVLLILSGISISMLSGDNGILKQAGNASTQTDIAGEKEILQTSALAAISKEKYGDLTKEKLDDELNKYSEIQSTEQVNDGIVVTFKSNRVYIVNFNGDVSRYYDIAIDNLVIKDGDNVLAENCKSVTPGKSLTINFNATMPNGTIKSITPNLAYTTTGSTTETFTIIGITSEGKEITKKYTINLKGYYDLPNLKVGDFVNYALNTPTAEQLEQLNSDISTYSGTTDNTEKTAAGTTLLCRVLEMDSNGNPTKLISADGVNTLKLSGANGYNNAVYLINEMCTTLYSGNQGTTRSLTIEDLENIYFDPTALTTAKNSDYGNKFRYTENDLRYPLLATKEKKIGINTATETVEENTFNILNTSDTALDLSEQERSDLESGGSKTGTTRGMTVTKTYYKMKAGDSNYKNATLNNIMHNSPTMSSNTVAVKEYYLDSRCIDVDKAWCYFGIRRVNSGAVYSFNLFLHRVFDTLSNAAVRPIITLNNEIQAEYVEAYNDTYNTWNLK